jgi:hypothetical protein
MLHWYEIAPQKKKIERFQTMRWALHQEAKVEDFAVLTSALSPAVSSDGGEGKVETDGDESRRSSDGDDSLLPLPRRHREAATGASGRLYKRGGGGGQWEA